MKPIDVKDNTYNNIDKEINDKNPKFKVGDHVRISKYKKFLRKAILQISLNTVPWTLMSLMTLMVKRLLEYFMKKYCKRQINKNLE